MGYKYFKIFIVSLFVFLLPVFSFALNEINVWENDINVEIIPENPEPYQEVTVKITSYATDLNKAVIEWRSGSSLLISGYGQTKYSFKVSGPNTSTVVDISITPEGSYQKINKQVVVSPTEVDMLWESVDGYTPPFYKGKALVTGESVIKVVALPIIKNGINQSNIVYNWRQDDSAKEDKSGYNKNYFIFSNKAMNNKENVSVTVSSVDGGYFAKDSIEVPISSPKIVFYKKSPILGVLYNKALVNDSYFPEKEFTITAEPYFLAIKEKESAFKNTWKVNSNLVPIQGREITLQPTATDGYATISVVMENFSTLFQKASGQLRISL